MNGRLGALYIGKKQVGGFLDWSYRPNLVTGQEGEDRTVKLQSWKVVAWAHWVKQQLLPGDAVRIKICADAGPAYWEADCKIASTPSRTLETLVHIQFELIGSGELEAGKVVE